MIYSYIKSNIPVEYIKKINGSIWQKYGTLIGTSTSGQSGPESNGNKGVIFLIEISRIGATLSVTV